MEKAHLANRGAAGLELEGGGMEMIDAPMIKQVRLNGGTSSPFEADPWAGGEGCTNSQGGGAHHPCS